MNGKNFKYINIALTVAIVAALALLARTTARFIFPAPRVETTSQPTARQVMPMEIEQTTKAVSPAPSPENIRDLKDVYANYTKEDAGSNMIEAWSRVKAEDKAKYIEGVDKQIAESKGVLAANPSDKRAKHMLFIAETMRKLAENNFNYSADEIPADNAAKDKK